MSDMESPDFANLQLKKVLQHVWSQFIEHFDAPANVDYLYAMDLIDDSTMEVILKSRSKKDANRAFLTHLRSNATIESLWKLWKLLRDTARNHPQNDRLATLLEDELKQWKVPLPDHVAAQRGAKGESRPSSPQSTTSAEFTETVVSDEDVASRLGIGAALDLSETPDPPARKLQDIFIRVLSHLARLFNKHIDDLKPFLLTRKKSEEWPYKLLEVEDINAASNVKSIFNKIHIENCWLNTEILIRLINVLPDKKSRDKAKQYLDAYHKLLGVFSKYVLLWHIPDDDARLEHFRSRMFPKQMVTYDVNFEDFDVSMLLKQQKFLSTIFQIPEEAFHYLTAEPTNGGGLVTQDLKAESEDQESRKIVQDALQNSSVRVQVAKCILLGPPEVGKTQLKRGLLGNFEKVLESTNCSTQATPAVELFIDNDGGKEWKTFREQHLKGFTSFEKNLVEKSHHLPTSTDESSPSHATNSSATKDNFISNPSQPPVDTNVSYESAPSQPTNPSDSSRTWEEFRRLSQAKARQIEDAKHESNDPPEFKLMYIIDNGGQPSFLDFHSVTATFPASYFLVYDASKGLDALPEMTFRKTDSSFRIKEMPPSIYSNYDLLRRSLLTVHHFTHRFKRRSELIKNLLPDFKPPSAPGPATLIIGTNKDTTDQKCENPDSDDKRLKRIYQNIPSLKHQVSVYCVDSMKPECKALKDIRSKVSQEDNLCQFPFPLSWFQLYLLSLSVGSDESLQVHKYSDLCQMCLQEKHVKSEREFRAMVSVMDCLGVFSCPDVEVLTSSAPDADVSNIFVFIDPNLLFEYVSRILIIPFLDLSQSPVCLRELQACGELTKKCIAKLNIPGTLSTLPGFHEKLLEWLVKWGLAAKMNGIDQWFIPSVLPPRPETASPLISNGCFCEVFPFYLTFTQETGINYTFHYLPAGFFPLFVVYLMQSKHFILPENNPCPENMQASTLPPRCRDSMLLLKISDSKYTFNVHLVDEADRLAVYMSPANQDLCSDASTLKHAGAILADLRDCMINTNNKLFSTSTDCITLCSACRCGLATQNQCHLAQIKENPEDTSWSNRCLHTDRLQSVCYEKSIDIDSDMAQILNGFATGLGSHHYRSQSPSKCQPLSPGHSPRSPRHRSRSPRHRSRSPRHRSQSPRQRLRSSKQRSRSPRQGSRSSRYRPQSESPRLISRSFSYRYTGRRSPSSEHRSRSSTHCSGSFSDRSQSPTHESNLSTSKYNNQTEANRQETTSDLGMSHATGTREMNVKTVIQSLRKYLNETLSIDTGLLTALQGEGLFEADTIKPWKSLLFQGKENEVRCELVDYIEGFYTPEYLAMFTDLLMKQSKKSKPILKDIAEKLRVEMGKGSSS